MTRKFWQTRYAPRLAPSGQKHTSLIWKRTTRERDIWSSLKRAMAKSQASMNSLSVRLSQFFVTVFISQRPAVQIHICKKFLLYTLFNLVSCHSCGKFVILLIFRKDTHFCFLRNVYLCGGHQGILWFFDKDCKFKRRLQSTTQRGRVFFFMHQRQICSIKEEEEWWKMVECFHWYLWGGRDSGSG